VAGVAAAGVSAVVVAVVANFFPSLHSFIDTSLLLIDTSIVDCHRRYTNNSFEKL
jgi:hypothetical protein